LNAAEVRYPEHDDRVDFFRRVLEEARSIPGVTAAGAAHVLPISDIAWGMGFSVEDLPPSDPSQTEVAFYRLVTPGYMGAMGIPLLEGRDFTDDDSAGNPWVAVVSQELVDLYWPGESGIGKRIKRRAYYSDNPWITVVGVVGDIHDTGLSDTVGGAIYLARGQYDRAYASVMSVVVRTSGSAEALVEPIQDRIRALDPNVPLFRVRTLENIVEESLAADRFTAVLLLVFSALGLTLAGAGVYGVMAHVAGERRREIALRLTFGARTSSVAGLMVAGAARLAVAGVALGLVASVGLTRLLGDLLFEVEALDPTIFVGVPASMVLVAIVSCLVPAISAARVDAGVTLRSD
jgi:putative ABC transport system permease protein